MEGQRRAEGKLLEEIKGVGRVGEGTAGQEMQGE